jgi:glycosyltransferase involved in cell wall biosynthesis
MTNVVMVTSPLGSQYNWGIKNYVTCLEKNMGKGVNIRLLERKKRISEYISKPRLPDADVIHLSSQTFGFYAPSIKYPNVITCHDMMAFSRPNLFESRREALLSRLAIKGMEKCDRVIAVSGFTKKQVVQYMGIDESKITAIHSGISSEFRPRRKKKEADYLVYFGSEEKRKNVAALIDAFFMLKKLHPELKLIKNYNNPRIWKRVCSLGLEKDVIITGNIREREMASYYSNAKAFVYPSLFEGFGFMPLEAMACGCPVAASSSTAMPEILGDAPVYFNPSDTKDIAEKISLILDDQALSGKLSRKSIQRAKRFSWKKTCRETKKVYMEVVG